MKNKRRKSKMIVISLGTNDIQYSATPMSQAEVDEKIVELRTMHADAITAMKPVTTVDELGISVSAEGAGQASGFCGRYTRRSEPADPK